MYCITVSQSPVVFRLASSTSQLKRWENDVSFWNCLILPWRRARQKWGNTGCTVAEANWWVLHHPVAIREGTLHKQNTVDIFMCNFHVLFTSGNDSGWKLTKWPLHNNIPCLFNEGWLLLYKTTLYECIDKWRIKGKTRLNKWRNTCSCRA